jgi:putative transposase
MLAKLRQRGLVWNHKSVYRVYCKMGLNLRIKPRKRLASRVKQPLQIPENINISWSLDYMSDSLMNGNKFRTVNILDDCNREALHIEASHSMPSSRVTKVLDNVAEIRGYPDKLRLDNGPENLSRNMQNWANKHGVTICYIQPGKPAQNALIERFNRTYREEVLNMNLFKDVAEVQSITEEWLLEYNTQRPHESLGNLTPTEYASRLNNSQK